MILIKEEMAYTCDGEVYVNKIKKNVKSVEALKITSTDVQKVCIDIDTYQEIIFEYGYSIQEYQEDVEDALYFLEDNKEGYCQVIPVNLDDLLNQGFKEVEDVKVDTSTKCKNTEVKNNFSKILNSYERVKDCLRQVDNLDSEVGELRDKADYFRRFNLSEEAEAAEKKANNLLVKADKLYDSLNSILKEELFEAVEGLKTKYDVFNSKDLLEVATFEDMATLMGEVL